jgi:hypothetical protein
MKRHLPIVLALTLLVSLLMGVMVVSAQDEEPDLVVLELINKSGDNVSLSLISGGIAYFLPVAVDETAIFTVERLVYTQTTFACGGTATGTVDVTTQVTLVFTSCFGAPANFGEPTIEKIQIEFPPEGVDWRYQLTPTPE